MSLSAKRALYCITFDCGNDWLCSATAFISVWPFAWPLCAKEALYFIVFGAEINGLELRQQITMSSLLMSQNYPTLFVSVCLASSRKQRSQKRALFFMVFGCGNKWLRGAEASVVDVPLH